MVTPPVRLDPHHSDDWISRLVHPTSVAGALRAARDLAKSGLQPGHGRTVELFETLATLASSDLAIARAIEPHLDATAILEQAGRADLFESEGQWGVFAAEGPVPLTASTTDDGWMLTGTKPWCSLARALDNALVSATDTDGERRLFAVDLHASGVAVCDEVWHARGLVEIPSGPVVFTGVRAEPIGEPGWYLSRPGFAWGGVAVAACWYGGAVGLGRDLFTAVTSRDAPGDILLMHLGRLDEELNSARRALAEAAAAIDSGEATGSRGKVLAKRVRSTVARAAESAIGIVGHALGPAPLAQDDIHAKRVADLQLYIRQHHAERDDQSLGANLISSGAFPW